MMLKIYLLLFAFMLKNNAEAKRVDNICSGDRLKRIFLRLGESGIITGYNITLYREGEKNQTWHESCQMEIVTCPSCIVSLNFKYMNLSCYFGGGVNLLFYNPYRCDYVWIAEPAYDASGVSFCRKISDANNKRANSGYRSKTRSVRISLFYSRPHFHAFTMEYKSESNRQFYFGSSDSNLNISKKYISSPFFPAIYPTDLVSEYVITCITPGFYVSSTKPAADLNCKIHLIFTDFQLASPSIMEFYDGKRRIKVIRGSSFRPPVIITSSNSLTVRFYAGGQNNLGFKALFSFISGAEDTGRCEIDHFSDGIALEVPMLGTTVTEGNFAVFLDRKTRKSDIDISYGCTTVKTNILPLAESGMRKLALIALRNIL